MWLNVCTIIMIINIIIVIMNVITVINNIIPRLARDVAERVQQGKLVVLREGEGRSSSPMVIKLSSSTVVLESIAQIGINVIDNVIHLLELNNRNVKCRLISGGFPRNDSPL